MFRSYQLGVYILDDKPYLKQWDGQKAHSFHLAKENSEFWETIWKVQDNEENHIVVGYTMYVVVWVAQEEKKIFPSPKKFFLGKKRAYTQKIIKIIV